MIKAINAGDKNELRKLLKMYSQAIYQRALAKTGASEHAKEVTRLVLSYVAACASSGTCQENVDAWLMSVTDAHANRYMENVRLEEEAKKSYFTAPTAPGTAPSSTAYDALKQAPIYENTQGTQAEEKNEFVPFSPTLSIPERPEFVARQDEYSTQSRISSVTPAPPIHIENGQPREFVPPQYIPPQYNPVQASSVLDEINAQKQEEKAPNYFADPVPAQNTNYFESNTPSEPVYEAPQAQFAQPAQESVFESPAPTFSDNIMPVSLTDDDEAPLSKKEKKKQKKQKKKSTSSGGVLIAVITIILLLVVGVLIAEIVSILIS